MFIEVHFWPFSPQNRFLTLKRIDSALVNKHFLNLLKKWLYDMGVKTGLRPQQGVQKTFFALHGRVWPLKKSKKNTFDPEDDGFSS